jgi:hypothetical protein
VDYTQVFDSVYGNKIVEYLAQYKVPAKLLRLIELTVISTWARVEINSEDAEEIKVESEVKQGDPLSATLFSGFRCNIQATRSNRIYIYTFKTVFCLCWWYINNYKNKMSVIGALQKLQNH